MATRNPGFTHFEVKVVEIPLFTGFCTSEVVVWDLLAIDSNIKQPVTPKLWMNFPKSHHLWGIDFVEKNR